MSPRIGEATVTVVVDGTKNKFPIENLKSLSSFISITLLSLHR